MTRTARQNTGKFPVTTSNAKELRFTIPKRRKGYSSSKQNRGKFPVTTSPDGSRRFKPLKP